jgi:hypothetical protein
MAKRTKLVDALGKAAHPQRESADPSRRPKLWWVFLMPGKVILWLEYMFPKSFTGVFGSARRRNVPLIQLTFSVYFYIALLVIVLSFIAPHH